jgi:hypothetical protein
MRNPQTVGFFETITKARDKYDKSLLKKFKIGNDVLHECRWNWFSSRGGKISSKFDINVFVLSYCVYTTSTCGMTNVKTQNHRWKFMRNYKYWCDEMCNDSEILSAVLTGIVHDGKNPKLHAGEVWNVADGTVHKYRCEKLTRMTGSTIK